MSWSLKWPEAPVPPDHQELRDAPKQILNLGEQMTVQMTVTSQLLGEMKEQGTEHHSENIAALSDTMKVLSDISSDAHAIAVVNSTLRKDVHVMMASQVDRLLERLPQSMGETKTEAKPRHRRAASA